MKKHKFYFHPTRGTDNNGNNTPSTKAKGWKVYEIKCEDYSDYNVVKPFLKKDGYLDRVLETIHEYHVEDEGVCQTCDVSQCEDINHFMEGSCGWNTPWTLFHEDDWINMQDCERPAKKS